VSAAPAASPKGTGVRPVPGLGLEGGAAPGRRAEVGLVLAAVVATVATCFVYGVTDLPFFQRDNQHYFMAGEAASRGVPPHQSAFDPKNMLPVLLAGAMTRLGDLAGLTPVASARILSVAAFSALVALMALFALRGTRRLEAGVFVVLGSLSLTTFLHHAALGGQPKIVLVLFLVATLVAVQAERYRLAAVLASLTFLCWQPALLTVATLGVVLLVVGAGRRRLLEATALVALPVLLYEGYFLATGALAEQWEQAYRFPSTSMTHSFPGFFSSLRDLSRLWDDNFGYPNVLPLIAGATIGLIGVNLLRAPRQAGALLRASPGWLYFYLTMGAILAFTFYDHQGVPDLLFVLPALAVPVGVGLAAAVARVGAKGGARWARAATALVAVGLLVLCVRAPGRQKYPSRYDLSDQIVAGNVVGHWLGQGETIYAVNAGHLLAFNRATNWIRHHSFFRGVNGYLQVETGNPDVFVPLRNGALPSMILVGNGRPYGWPAWLMEHYLEVTPPAFAHQGVSAWRRKPVARAGDR
jgi:hypothetical protein